jgi:hypothetical protein
MYEIKSASQSILAQLRITFRTYVTRPRAQTGRGADVAERRAAAPRSPRRPLRAPMHIRAVMRSGELKRARNGWLLSLSRGKNVDEVVHTDDLDHLECAKVQEMFISSNQVIGLRRDGAVDKMIVTRIIHNHIEML